MIMDVIPGVLGLSLTFFFVDSKCVRCLAISFLYSFNHNLTTSFRLLFDLFSPPLNGSSDQNIQRAVLNSNHHFKGRGWHNKSPQAKDFINRLLHRDVTKRFSAKEALMHPWIVEHWMDKMNVVEGCW